METFKKTLTILGLSLALIALVALFFGYIRYDQVIWQNKRTKEDKSFAEKEYLRKLTVDNGVLNKEINGFIEILKKQKPNSLALTHSLNLAKNEFKMSLNGIAGKIDPVVRYDKDLRQPPGVFLKEHNLYYQSLQKIMLTFNKIGKKKHMASKEKLEFVKKLQEQIGQANEAKEILLKNGTKI